VRFVLRTPDLAAIAIILAGVGCFGYNFNIITPLLAQDVPLMLLDEAVAHLDLHHQILVLRQLRALADAGFRVIAVDLKGHGLSDKPLASDEYTIDGGDLRLFLNETETTESYTGEIVGSVRCD